MRDETATFGNQYLRALAVQGRVIHALILREVKTRFWKNRLGYLWAVVEPVTHIAVWFVIVSVISANPFYDQTQRILLLSTGLVPFLTFRNIAGFMEYSITANQALLNFPVVRHLDLLLARFLLEAATMTIVSIIIVSGLIFFGFSQVPDDLAATGFALSYSVLLGFGFGMFNAVMTILSDFYKRLLDVSMRILYFCSGVMFSLETMPVEIKSWLVWNPMLHAVELFRAAFFPLYRAPLASPSYVLAWAMGLALTGIVAARLAGPRLNHT